MPKKVARIGRLLIPVYVHSVHVVPLAAFSDGGLRLKTLRGQVRDFRQGILLIRDLGDFHLVYSARALRD
jgi:hypothetical protein